MGYLLFGLLFGFLAGWLIQGRLGGIPIFEQVLRKELVQSGHLGSELVLKKRLEEMEKKLAQLEGSIATAGESAAVELQAAVQEPDAAPDKVPRLRVLSASAAQREKEQRDRRLERQKVAAMWQGGKSVAEIAAQTSLGKGEVELVVAMQKERQQQGEQVSNLVQG